jgi:hypothetical protein
MTVVGALATAECYWLGDDVPCGHSISKAELAMAVRSECILEVQSPFFDFAQHYVERGFISNMPVVEARSLFPTAP